MQSQSPERHMELLDTIRMQMEASSGVPLYFSLLLEMFGYEMSLPHSLLHCLNSIPLMGVSIIALLLIVVM